MASRAAPTGPHRPVPAWKEIGLPTENSTRELDQLRAEVTRLKAEAAQAREQARTAQAQAQAGQGASPAGPHAAPGTARARRRIGWRAPVATLLIVLGCLLAPLSVLGVWSANQISSTSRYVANVTPLISQPSVQSALTDKITAKVTSQVNVQGIAKQAAAQLSARGLTRLGTLIASFSGTIASGVNGFIHTAVGRIISSALVARLWVQANQVAHTELVKALSGAQGGAISISGGEVVIGLGPFIDQVKHNLAARGLTLVNKLPPVNPTFPLFSAKYLVKAQSAYRLLNTLKWVLPLAAIVFLAAGIYLARRHRRALVGAGLGLAASMLLLGIALAVTRVIYLNSVPPSVLPADAAATVFDTLVRFIKQGLRVLLVLGLVVALAGFLTGPSVTAVRTRGAFTSAFGWIRGTGERAGLNTGPVGTWVYRHRTVLRAAAVAIAGLTFVFWSRPTGAVVLGIAIALLLVLGLIELIGRPPAEVTAARAHAPRPR
ncbi:MAG TPA: hypothetical protein VN840_20630 [Streptosporangiaceae bacterium]|nr:hypothetical protein [Streptosporangiaceae bacterium]